MEEQQDKKNPEYEENVVFVVGITLEFLEIHTVAFDDFLLALLRTRGDRRDTLLHSPSEEQQKRFGWY